ncbi:protein OSCP1 isoform X1 [Canis lupus baileyi]|uniref:protein OSCP1 isoform X1 n=1 Tax=Canis lupus dingo TaxID=286419 RepID=UPI000DC6AC80|nr:protein OSCP1 isoform X1 [Canis lupus dingo]XP_038307787.1 protein OSCP1 isoform X1 [Canis lupus familiaris]XP_038413810.1 protein OSCP1 isoform X1 [Canis lupus familiaris]XP_038543450.1 protein OSCP1 isoform X1 [Canis lupus familiaris]
MSVRTLPLLFLNLGGEMLYILDQRLRAQNIPGDKAHKVLNDIISTMFNRKFMEELFKPQELYSKKALRTVYDRLAHASIMRLNQASMDKLYDLMTMAFKYQVLLCPRPKDVLLVTFNHLDTIKGFIQDSPTILHQVEETFRQLTEPLPVSADIRGPLGGGVPADPPDAPQLFSGPAHPGNGIDASDARGRRLSGNSRSESHQHRGEHWEQTRSPGRKEWGIRGEGRGESRLQQKVSIFLKDRVQNSNGRFVLPVSGPVPWGTEVPGLIRMFNNKGKEVKKVEFKHGGHYVTAPKEGSFELCGDRVLKLGTNMYSINRPVETHMSGASKNLASRTQESIVPNPLAKEELNLLARLMGGMEIKKASGPEPGFRLNLFTTDEEEEQAALTRPEELSYEVINIQATQDQQRHEELARIMGEFEVTEQPRPSTSKGDDLLAMMDEL